MTADLIRLQNDPDLRVRMQLAFSLGETSNVTLTALVQAEPANKNLLIAALSSSPNHPEAATWQKALKAAPPNSTAPALHRLKNEGNEIGPDLGTVAAKPDEQLLEAILDPNRAVEQRYLTHTIRTKDGKDHIGLLAEETANSLTLKLGAATEVILRAEIAKSTPGTQSLMPAGLESVLKAQDIADLLAWMRAR
jgi:putative heme-binding domain-containing protein